MDKRPPATSIYQRCRDVRQRLLDLISRIEDDQPQKPPLSDTLERFMLWAGNLGAMRQPSSRLSLDQRLANAPEVHGLICRHLADICEAVDDLSGTILAGPGSKVKGDSPDDDDDDTEISDPDMESDEPFDEASMILEVIAEAISSLFRLGILVRKASPTDRFKRALQMSDTMFNDTFDIGYVREKHPKIRNSHQDWLPTRLGRLISKRRMFIKYSREHKARLEFDEPPPGDLPERQAAQTERQSSKATTFHLDQLPPSALAPPAENEAGPEEEDVDEVMSVMSASTMSNTLSVLKLPALADLSADGQFFECPICFTLQRFQREKAWRVHAFRDLKAYVCTAGGSDQCNGEYFGDRNTWFEHEMQHHRAQYACTLCHDQQPVSRDAFVSHVAECHPHLTSHQLKAVEDVSRHVPTHFDANDCPFCDDWAEQIRQRADPTGKRPVRPISSSNTTTMVSATRFKRHVALHQEQLAIFAVPRTVEGGDKADEGGTDNSIATSDSVSAHHSIVASSDSPGELDHSIPGHSIYNRAMRRLQTIDSECSHVSRMLSTHPANDNEGASDFYASASKFFQALVSLKLSAHDLVTSAESMVRNGAEQQAREQLENDFAKSDERAEQALDEVFQGGIRGLRDVASEFAPREPEFTFARCRWLRDIRHLVIIQRSCENIEDIRWERLQFRYTTIQRAIRSLSDLVRERYGPDSVEDLFGVDPGLGFDGLFSDKEDSSGDDGGKKGLQQSATSENPIVEDLRPLVDISPADEDAASGGDQPTTTTKDQGEQENTDTSRSPHSPQVAALDRWAQIRKKAAERAARRVQDNERDAAAAGDGNISEEEIIKSRVARIKARVAELTGDAEDTGGPKVGVSTPADQHKIKCICTFAEEDKKENLIHCEKCQTWQHIQCYYPAGVEDALQFATSKHSCVDCDPTSRDHESAIDRYAQRIRQELASRRSKLGIKQEPARDTTILSRETAIADYSMRKGYLVEAEGKLDDYRAMAEKSARDKLSLKEVFGVVFSIRLKALEAQEILLDPSPFSSIGTISEVNTFRRASDELKFVAHRVESKAGGLEETIRSFVKALKIEEQEQDLQAATALDDAEYSWICHLCGHIEAGNLTPLEHLEAVHDIKTLKVCSAHGCRFMCRTEEEFAEHSRETEHAMLTTEDEVAEKIKSRNDGIDHSIKSPPGLDHTRSRSSGENQQADDSPSSGSPVSGTDEAFQNSPASKARKYARIRIRHIHPTGGKSAELMLQYPCPWPEADTQIRNFLKEEDPGSVLEGKYKLFLKDGRAIFRDSAKYLAGTSKGEMEVVVGPSNWDRMVKPNSLLHVFPEYGPERGRATTTETAISAEGDTPGNEGSEPAQVIITSANSLESSSRPISASKSSHFSQEKSVSSSAPSLANPLAISQTIPTQVVQDSPETKQKDPGDLFPFQDGGDILGGSDFPWDDSWFPLFPTTEEGQGKGGSSRARSLPPIIAGDPYDATATDLEDVAPISLPTSIVVENPSDAVVLQRAQNILAARQSGERIAQQMVGLKQRIEDLTAETEHYQGGLELVRASTATHRTSSTALPMNKTDQLEQKPESKRKMTTFFMPEATGFADAFYGNADDPFVKERKAAMQVAGSEDAEAYGQLTDSVSTPDAAYSGEQTRKDDHTGSKQDLKGGEHIIQETTARLETHGDET